MPKRTSKRAQPSSAPVLSWTGGWSASATALSCADQRLVRAGRPHQLLATPVALAQRRLQCLVRAEHLVDQAALLLERLRFTTSTSSECAARRSRRRGTRASRPRARAAPRPPRSRTRPRRRPAGDQAGTAEADGDLLDAVVVAAVVLDDGAQHRLVGRQAGRPRAVPQGRAAAAPRRAARSRPRAVAGRARPLPRRRCPPRAQGRGRDVHHRHVRPSGREQLQRVGAWPPARGSSGRCGRSRRGPRSAESRARSCSRGSCRSRRRAAPARQASTASKERNLRTAAKSTANMNRRR